jgi:hypothetical protein
VENKAMRKAGKLEAIRLRRITPELKRRFAKEE